MSIGNVIEPCLAAYFVILIVFLMLLLPRDFDSDKTVWAKQTVKAIFWPITVICFILWGIYLNLKEWNDS